MNGTIATTLTVALDSIGLAGRKTKVHSMRNAQEHDGTLDARIVGVETADHPTNAELVARLRHCFHESPQRGGP